MSCNGWKDTTIGDQITLQRGYDITKSEQKEGYVPVISSSGIKSFHDTARVNGPGVVLGRKGVVGSVYFVTENYWPHDTTLYVKDFKGNNPRFVYYFFRRISEYLSTMDVGSANPTLNRNHVHPMIVQWPSVPEQKSIAATLSCLDDKIELNNRINKNLEEIAQAIFKSWFVDFEPFQDGEFEDSELGRIPKGWRVVTLEDIVDSIDNRGKTPPLSLQVTSFPIIDVKALSGDSRIIDYNNCTKYVEETTYKNWFRSGHPKQQDILVSTVGSLAEMKIFYGDKGCIAQNVVGFRSKGLSPLYLYQYLQYIKSDLISYNIGSVQPSIKVTHIIKHKILVPDEKSLDFFEVILNAISNKIFENSREIQKLMEVRDTLLPKLMSGEIRVPIEEVQ